MQLVCLSVGRQERSLGELHLYLLLSKYQRLLFVCCSYLSTSAGAPSAAYSVASDSPCKSGLQQLLSPGVQAVQLLHGDWRRIANQS